MATISKVRENRRSIRQATRCSNRATKQVEGCTHAVNYNGFLNHRFKPLFNIPAGNWRKTEREFFCSLSNLCRLYDWTMPDVSHLDYPLNVSTALEEMSNKCKEQKLSCIITQDNSNITSITTVKTYNTGNTLYYIPVRPLWLLFQKKEQPILTKIWLELFRYLYHIAGVVYYRQDGYLNRIYDTLQDWIEDDCDREDEAYKKEQQETFDTMQDAGDKLYAYIKKKFNAVRLRQLLQQYRLSGYYEIEVEKIITDCLNLWAAYPNRSVYENIDSRVRTFAYDETIYVDFYMSFFWSSNDCLYDTLMEMINSELMEMSYQQEPVTRQCFDKPQSKELHDFDFETRFFTLMEDISETLNRLEKVQLAS